MGEGSSLFSLYASILWFESQEYKQGHEPQDDQLEGVQPKDAQGRTGWRGVLRCFGGGETTKEADVC